MLAPLEAGDDVAPQPAGDRAEGPGEGTDQEQRHADQAPLRLDEQRVLGRAAQRGDGVAVLGAGGGGARYVVGCRPRRSWRPASTGRRADSPADAVSRSRNGPSRWASSSRRAVLDDAAAIEDGDLLGALGGREPVSDQQAGATRRAAGRRRATTRASVSGSIRAVASSSTTTRTSRTSSRANATSCSSPADRLVPPGPSRVSSPRGRPATQAVRPSSSTAASTVSRGSVGEERDVLGEGAGQDLGALGDHADRRAELLEVEVEDVDAAEEQRSRARARRRGRASEARVDLPDPVRPTRAHVVPAGTARSTPDSAKVPWA